MAKAWRVWAIGAGVAAAVIVLMTAAQAAITLSVTPSTGLIEGQVVTVTGGGFKANDTVTISECLKSGTQTVCISPKTTTTGSAGGFSNVKFTVHKAVNGKACLESNPCFIRARDTGNNSADKAIHFKASNTTTTRRTTTTTTAPEPCGKPTIKGTAENDTLNGTSGPDVIAGVGGNDTINGLGGDDTLCGGKGTDTVRGGAGRDLVLGGENNDSLDGGADKDICGGGPGTDTATNCETRTSIP
jgi:Ca2+-binding RTX toxin-like protein